jgi:hypothetical protein
VAAGPIRTGRLGNALGIDLGSQDLTLAVSRDNRMPRASVVVTTAARQLIRLNKAAEKLDSIVAFGSVVDPTSHPRFREVTENLRDLRNKWFPRAKLVLLAPAPHLAQVQARISVSIYDRAIVRLEGGTVKSFGALTGRKGPELTELTRALAQLENLIIEARFFRGKVDTTTENEVRGWIRRLAEIKPCEVHVLTPEKKTSKGVLRPAPRSVVDKIAAEAGEKLGVPVGVHEDGVLFPEHAEAVPPATAP